MRIFPLFKRKRTPARDANPPHRDSAAAIPSQQTVSAPPHEDAMEMALQIIDKACSRGLMEKHEPYPHIPEIIVARKEVCNKLFHELMQDKEGRNPFMWFAWSAYAGMGAVYLWAKDWDTTRRTGIAESLIAPRTIDEMDEFVIDSIGIGFDTPQGQEFSKKIYHLAVWAFAQFVPSAEKSQYPAVASEVMQAMYIFGMVLQMARMRMR